MTRASLITSMGPHRRSPRGSEASVGAAFCRGLLDSLQCIRFRISGYKMRSNERRPASHPVKVKNQKFSRIARTIALLLALLCVAGISCESQHKVSTGGETHFLRLCDPSADACGTEFSCICNVCTRPCDGDSACADLPGAQCAESPSEYCGGTDAQDTCEVSCAEDNDCAILSDEHRCESNVCRSGTAPTGTGGEGNLNAGGAEGDPICETGTVNANELVILGDSFFATTHQVTAFLEDLARSAGVLSVGDRYQDKSRLIENALALDGQGILSQYDSAAVEAPVKVVITNGGGADVLLGSCNPVGPDCPLLVNAAAAFADLLARLQSDGVSDVVYVFYPDPQDVAVLERMNALRPLVQEICVGSELPCHFVDLRPV